MAKSAVCPNCRKHYRMGYNGTVDGCDKCMGVVRDGDGYVYGRGETEITLMDVGTGKITKRKRPAKRRGLLSRLTGGLL